EFLTSTNIQSSMTDMNDNAKDNDCKDETLTTVINPTNDGDDDDVDDDEVITMTIDNQSYGLNVDDDDKIDNDDETTSNLKEEHSLSDTSPTPSASFTGAGGSSSSRRKNAAPQRQPVDIDNECSPQNEQNEDSLEDDKMASKTSVEKSAEMKTTNETPKNIFAASLATNINPQNRIQEMIDIQKRIYSNWIEQQKKLLGANDEEQKRAQIQLIQQQIQRDYAKLAQSLKQELINGLNSSIDKIIAEFIAAEAASSARRTTAALAEQQREQAAAVAVNRNPFLFHPLYHSFNGQSGPFPNPFMQNSLPLPPPPPPPPSHHSPGIFPAASAPRTTFNPFVPHLKAASPATATFRKIDDLSSFAPRKKRSKVTDSSRINKVQPIAAIREASSLPNSARSSPQLSSYFPPTMVGHPLYGGGTFGTDDRDSPINSDDASDCGPYDGNIGGSSTLTPMHLRKAKLMFFYTRYPNSSLLKSYFPDIRFNKNNTAQLVKWFSNF
uniref:Prospero domain-containing protein n=2 Tax=Onchocerca ochengi TaxID=42157 RepID=A0A182EQ55_ONCOC